MAEAPGIEPEPPPSGCHLTALGHEQANALIAYFGALQLLVMSPRNEVAALRTRAEARVHDLFSAVPDVRLATRTLQDPTSDSPTCLLGLVDPMR